MATTRFEARVETDVLAVIRRAAEIQGRTMSVNALRRAASSEIPAVALTVDAKDEGAAAFYGHFGFQSLTHDPLALFLPLATV
ncbi:DUF1778 domain-containing protein [Burkholderia metallica]|uniref:type II toxin -antitoxin system TacA 1-like antitoxin n=1 Tax=Burkholderia metallica TaxID=488729 RepID=UPI001FC824CC|nr:hypothetical protein [Burkholderia metallica]